MIRKIRPGLKRVLVIVSAFFVVLLLSFLIFREGVIRRVLDGKIASAEKSTGWTIRYRSFSIHGFSTVRLEGLSILNDVQDSLLYLETAEVNVKPLRFLLKRPFVRYIDLENGWLQAHHFSRKTPGSKSESVKPADRESAFEEIYRLYKRIFPDRVQMNNLALEYQDSLGMMRLALQELVTSGDHLQGGVLIDDGQNAQRWILSGNLSEGIRGTVYPEKAEALPILYSRFKADLRIDSLQFDLSSGEEGSGIGLKLAASCKGFRVYHHKISADTVQFDEMGADFLVNVDDGLVVVDSASTFHFNRLQGRVGMTVPFGKDRKLWALQVRTDWMEANTFFAALPKGAFDDTRNLKASGRLKYSLDFRLDGHHPDDVIFASSLQRDQFRIQSYPGTPLHVMSGEFTYQAYEQDRLVRSFPVGPSKADFVPLAAVPQNLINAILTAEDPSFFHHAGFIQEAFRESIATNYKAGSFKRGGSTISMQLVKNVFLSRKKNIFRKMEEALIVWLVETQRLTSKDRMMEVYLNIIEWGPGVYGIGEASRFYFGKSPSELNLAECLYLANIIPRPKKFKYCFDPEGNLRPFMQEQCQFVVRRMVLKEMLTSGDTVGFQPQVNLKGPARELVIVAPDTLINPLPEDFFRPDSE